MVRVLGKKHSLDEGKIRVPAEGEGIRAGKGVGHVGHGSSPPRGTQDLFRVDRLSSLVQNGPSPLEHPPQRPFGNAQGASGKRIESSRPLGFLDPVAQAEPGVLEGAPQDAHPWILVGRLPCLRLPFPDQDGIVEVVVEVRLKVPEKRTGPGRSQNGEGPREIHLGTQHHHAGHPQAMVGVKVAEGQDLEPPQAQPQPFPGNLGAFSRIEKVGSSPQTHGQGGEHALGHGHHAAGSQEKAVKVRSHGVRSLKVDEWAGGGPKRS
ncbi:MAG: hypothetical protein BWY88_01343 [Synergistetes bacterium ADurb.Bin520]|nr:MAG: hypothetical protein BWY88_01343 [Synergistetes bacterium ADurb.Bin520]